MIDVTSAARIRSQSTICLRRSNRSANAPANGPNNTAGASLDASTAPVANSPLR